MTFSIKNNALIVTALSLLLVLTCLCPAFATKQATADDIPITQRHVYYYSDRGNLDSAITSQMQSIGIPLSNYHSELVRNNTALFMDNFIDYADGGEYIGMQNAYIIFELRENLLDFASLNIVPQFLLKLNYMFQHMKNNGCKIMFISNTEEFLLYLETDLDNPSMSAAAFLNYVDIHISLDLMSILSVGIAQRLESSNSITLYMDSTYDLFLKYLLRFLRYKYDIRISDFAFQNNKDVILRTLYENQQAIIFAQQDILKYKLLGINQEYFINDLIDDPVFIGKVAALGTITRNAYPTNSQFFGNMNSLRNRYGEQFDYYIYNAIQDFYDIEIPELNNVGEIYSIWYHPNNFFTVKLPAMIKDFINNSSLSEYDNWFGRAALNHKPIEFGDNGWISLDEIADAYENMRPIEWLILWDPILED